MNSRIAIPLQPLQNVTDSIAPSFENPGQKKILLIEGCDRDAEIAKGLLRRSRGSVFTVMRALCAQEALGLISSQNYDAVLVSLDLNETAGIDIVRSLVQLKRQVPIIVLTAYDDARMAIKVLRLGAKDCIAKSELNSQRLEDLIASAIGRLNKAKAEDARKAPTYAMRATYQKQLTDQWSWSLTKSRLINRNAGLLLTTIDRIHNEKEADGREARDQVLWDCSQKIAEAVRGVGTFARLQSDGFAIILEGVRCKTEIDLLRNSLFGNKTTRAIANTSQTDYTVISGGALAKPECDEDFATMIDRAAAELSDLKSLTVPSRVYEIVNAL